MCICSDLFFFSFFFFARAYALINAKGATQRLAAAHRYSVQEMGHGWADGIRLVGLYVLAGLARARGCTAHTPL
jgi:hypothetical protein